MERIKSEIKNLIKEWRWHCSAEAKYRCEAYGELLDFINSLQEEQKTSKNMTRYIDKSAIVAEIESLRRSTFTNFDEGVNCAVQTLLEIIDTLEVKEVQEEPVSKDLEEAADNYVGHAPEIDEDLSCFTKRNAFIAGAQWKKEQCQKTIELAEDHAYLAGQEKVIEKACEWLKCNFNMPNDFESHFKKAMEE